MTNEVKEELSILFDSCLTESFNNSVKEVRASLLIDAIAKNFAADNDEMKLELRDVFDPTYCDIIYSKEEFVNKFTKWMLTTTSDGAAKLNRSINSAVVDRSFEYVQCSTPLHSQRKWPKSSVQKSPFTPIAQPDFIPDNFLPNPEEATDGSSLDNSFVRSLKTSFYDVKSQLSQTRERAETYEMKYISILENYNQLQKENQRLHEALCKKNKHEETPEESEIDSTVENELADYKFKLAQANAKVSALCETNHSLRQEIGKLKVQLLVASDTEKSLKHRVQDLKSEVTTSNSRMLSLEVQLENAQTKVSDLTMELYAAHLGKSESALSIENSCLKEEVAEIKTLFDEISAIEPIKDEREVLLSPKMSNVDTCPNSWISCGVELWPILWPFLSLCIVLFSVILHFQTC